MEWDDGRICLEGLKQEHILDCFNKKDGKLNENTVFRYEGIDFVRQCYHVFLGRAAKENELDPYLELMKDGMEKEGIVYCFISSLEYKIKKTVTVKYEKLYHNKYLKYEWDYSSLLRYNGEFFVRMCYKEILCREPDEEGYINYCECLDSGMPKEAVLYLFMTSREIEKEKRFKKVDEYGEIYDNYNAMLHSPAQRIKGKLKKVVKMPFTIAYIYRTIINNERKKDLRNERITNKLAELEHENYSIMEYIHYLEIQVERSSVLIEELPERNGGEKGK